MQKEYGKLTADQFHELIQFVPQLLTMLRETNELLSSTPADKFDRLFPGDYGSYCHVYELPFIQHLNWVVYGMNRTVEVQDMAKAIDPQEAVLELLRKHDAIEDKPHHPDFSEGDLAALVYSLARTIQSMVTYGRSISSLIQDVRENNNHDSLFKAIRMDRTVIGTPTAMKVIARAQLKNSKAFFKGLKSALGGPNNKQHAWLDRMRYAMIVLREMNLEISEADLERLMVEKLAVYSKNHPNARKNIRAHYQWTMKLPTI